MCFSATASFVAGTSLSVIGIVTLKQAKTKSEIPVAIVPLLFGVQQLVEGIIWLSFRTNAPLVKQVMTYIYFGLAFLSFIGAYVVDKMALFSIWCFFAAVLSLMIYFLLRFRNLGGFPKISRVTS